MIFIYHSFLGASLKKLFKFLATTLTLIIFISCIKTNNTSVNTTYNPQVISSTSENIIGELYETSVALIRSDGGAYCGGTWISNHHILTARHCLEDMFIQDPVGQVVTFKTYKELNRKYPPEKAEISYTAVIHSVDPDSDVGLLFTMDEIPHKIAPIRHGEVAVGESMHVIGHPSSLEFTYLPGIVSQIRFYEKTYVFSLFNVIEMRQKVIQMNSDVWFGNSGGAAYDNKGALVGVASFIRQDRGMSFFVHKDMIITYLNKNKVKYYLR